MTAVAIRPELAPCYQYCRRLNARHGKTFYLATALLPAAQRPAVHALYGFARYADDIVDRPDPGRNPAERLADLSTEVDRALAGGAARHPVVRALADTVRGYEIEPILITDFLKSMTADLTVTRYPSFDALAGYMWGSASVIGLQLLPVLGVVGDPDAARTHASQLGIAFQLTNFIRDIGEDYRRGRIYLPMDGLAEHAVTPSMLEADAAGPQLRALVADEVERARTFYRRAEPGIDLLAPTARDCVRTAYRLYGGILDVIEANGFDVLARRATVPQRRRMAVAGPGLARAWWSRRAARRDARA